MESLFPFKERVIYSNLRLTPEGLYSVTKRIDGERLIAFLHGMIPGLGKQTITDATACVGSDTLLFSLHFKKVHSIEWKRHNMEALQNNVDVFEAQNVSLHEGDATRIFDWNTNVLYVDPPWGGPNYYKVYNLELFMGSYRLDNWIEEILKRDNRPETVVLKLPRNYNFTRLQFLPNVESTHFYRIRNFIVVMLRVSI
jgi:predicted RNA methylase